MEKKEFFKWNSGMFDKYGNDRLYNHPNPLLRWIEAKRVSSIVSWVGETDSVLEVGCGEGHVLSRIRAKRKFGVDLSPRAVEIAKQRTGAKIVLADAENLPFPDSCFDSLVCTEVLEHLRDPRIVIKECARVVKDGGRIAFSIPNEGRINFFKDIVSSLGLLWLFPGIPKRMDSEWHLHSFNKGMLLGMLPKNGELVRVQSIPPLISLRYVAMFVNRNNSPENEIRLVCPDDMFSLEDEGSFLKCNKCRRTFPKKSGSAKLLPKDFFRPSSSCRSSPSASGTSGPGRASRGPRRQR